MAIKLIVCFFILLFFQVTETMLLGRTSIRNNLLNNFTHPLRQHVLKRGLPQRKTQMSSRWAFTLIGNISSSFWDYTGKLWPHQYRNLPQSWTAFNPIGFRILVSIKIQACIKLIILFKVKTHFCKENDHVILFLHHSILTFKLLKGFKRSVKSFDLFNQKF